MERQLSLNKTEEVQESLVHMFGMWRKSLLYMSKEHTTVVVLLEVATYSQVAVILWILDAYAIEHSSEESSSFVVPILNMLK